MTGDKVYAPANGSIRIYLIKPSSMSSVLYDDLVISITTPAQVSYALIQADDYYPFGMPMGQDDAISAGSTDKNRFLYQGKEYYSANSNDSPDSWQVKLALNIYDFHARQYDPATGRFNSIDPQGQFASGYLGMGNMPTMGVDPDGEFLFIPAFFIGAFINFSIQCMTGNIDSFGEAIGSYAIGGLAGVAGAGAGQAVAGLVGTVGAGAGAAVGAAGGAAGGFIGGAGNAWLGGANFSDGLVAGGYGAAIGAAAGGLIGGISGGINSIRHGGKFWSGHGATFDDLITSGSESLAGDEVEYSTKSAKEFSSKYGMEPEGLNNLYADGSMPANYTEKNGIVYNEEGIPTRGTTRYLTKGKSDVYLYKAAFVSKEQLYFTMNHEYMHVAHNSYFKGDVMSKNPRAAHASIAKWEYHQARIWKYNENYYYRRYLHYSGYSNSSFDVNKFGFHVLSFKPWEL